MSIYNMSSQIQRYLIEWRGLKSLSFIPVLIVFLVQSLSAQSAGDWKDTGYGEWKVFHIANSPFPYKPSDDPAFNDNSCYVFIPEGFIRKDYVDYVIDHHGHGAIVDPENIEQFSYVELFRQDYQLYSSGKNAILIMPQAARNKSSGAIGSFAEFNKASKFVDEITSLLISGNKLNPGTVPRKIFLNSFSGGYQITASHISNNDSSYIKKIGGITLWDSYYGNEKEYMDYVLSRRGYFLNFFTPYGGTLYLSEKMLDSLRGLSIPADSVFNAYAELPQILINATHKRHFDVSRANAIYGRVLQKLPLDDIGRLPAPQIVSALQADGEILLRVYVPETDIERNVKITTRNSAGLRSVFSAGKGISNFEFPQEGLTEISISESGSEAGDNDPVFSIRSGEQKPELLFVNSATKKFDYSKRTWEQKEFIARDLSPFVRDFMASGNPSADYADLDAVTNGIVSLSDYRYVLWFTGDNGREDKIYDNPGTAQIRDYLSQGGNLLLAGSGIADDIGTGSTGKVTKDFALEHFGINGMADTAAAEIVTESKAGLHKYPVTGLVGLGAAVEPLFAQPGKSVFASFMKKEIAGKTSSAMAAVFEPDQANSGAFSVLVGDFMRLAATIPVTPPPPTLPDELAFIDGKVIMGGYSNADSFLITFYSSAKQKLGDTLVINPAEFEFPMQRKVFFRIQPVSGRMTGQGSEMLGGIAGINAKKALIVNGYDRATGHNDRDYAVEHITSLENSGFSFDFASNEYFMSGNIDVTQYQLIDWIAGEESTEDKTFSPGEQDKLRNYVEAGGRLIVSGSEIGWDLWENSRSENGRNFIREVFGISYVSDDADTYITIAGRDTLQFGTNYSVHYPDAYQALPGSEVLANYPNGHASIIGMKHSGGGRTVFGGFPFDSLKDAGSRNLLFLRVINFLFD